MENTNEELKPCPFCGEALKGEIDDGARFHTHPDGPCWFSGNEFDMIDAARWNRRAAPVAGMGTIDTPQRMRWTDSGMESDPNGVWCRFDVAEARAEEARREGAEAERARLVQTITNANNVAAEALRQRDEALTQRTAGGGVNPSHGGGMGSAGSGAGNPASDQRGGGYVAPLVGHGGGTAYNPLRADHALRVSRTPVEEAAAQAPSGPVTWTAADEHRLDTALHETFGTPAPTAQPTPPDDERASPTFMDERQAQDWAWKAVRRDCDDGTWTTGESGNYFGFFLHGWRYREQYERQARAALRHPPVPNVGEQTGDDADVLNLLHWLYRRLPRAYGRPPHVERTIDAMAKRLGTETGAFFVERGAAPNPADEDAALLDWLDSTNARFKMGWKVGQAPAGCVSVQSIIFAGNQPVVTIREAIRAARAAAANGGS